jgi:hypothetical protein
MPSANSGTSKEPHNEINLVVSNPPASDPRRTTPLDVVLALCRPRIRRALGSADILGERTEV